jgi:hypothetical protein
MDVTGLYVFTFGLFWQQTGNGNYFAAIAKKSNPQERHHRAFFFAP